MQPSGEQGKSEDEFNQMPSTSQTPRILVRATLLIGEPPDAFERGRFDGQRACVIARLIRMLRVLGKRVYLRRLILEVLEISLA